MTVKHTELFLIRHGQTDSNVNGLFHGITDIPLNPVGIEQAKLVARRLEAMEHLQSLHSSPLSRALVTAEAIGATIGLVPRVHEGLAEMDFGEAEGLPLSVMIERYPELAARFADLEDDDARFPGGESRHEFHRRVRDVLDQITTDQAGQRILIGTHAGVIGSIIAQIHGENPNDWRRYPIDNCSVTHIELATDGPIAHVVNDVVHLEQIDLSPVVETDIE